MAVILRLQTDDDTIIPLLDGQPLAAPTPLADLPSLAVLQADPYAYGPALMAALGGAALLERLDADAEGLFLLQADAAANQMAWEFAVTPDRQFLVTQYGCLRLVDRAVAPPPPPAPLNFIVVGANPLVGEDGHPYDGYRLNIDGEISAIKAVLDRSGQALSAQRTPPTRDSLLQAFSRSRGPVAGRARPRRAGRLCRPPGRHPGRGATVGTETSRLSS